MRMSSINDTGSDRVRAGKSVACKMILTSPNLSLSLEIVKNPMMFPCIGQCKPDFSGFAFNGFLVD